MSKREFFNFRFIFLLVIVMCFTPHLRAQTRQWDQEISLGFGFKSGTEILGFGFIAANSTDDNDYKETANKGMYFASYRGYVASHVALGITVGTQFFSFNHFTDYSGITPDFQFNGNVTTIAFEVKLVYPRINLQYFQLYALMGVGYSFFSETATPYQTLPSRFFNSQWTPLGLYFGDNFGGFVELGFGYKGLLNAGIAYRIKARKRNL